jgi:F420-dependent oxidoreductase-like protein
MTLRLPAPSLVVLIGPSASGKSTWAAEHFSPNEIVSSDSLRAKVGAGEDDQAAGNAAFDILDRIVAERVRRGLTTVIDTTGLDPAARERWIGMGSEAGIPVHAVVFDTDSETCERRNDASPRPIPKTVLRRQIARFATAKKDLSEESFAGVHIEQPVAITAIAAPTEVERSAGSGTVGSDAGHTFGLIVSRFDWDDELGATLEAIARRAEAAGFRDIWVMDHFRQIRGVGRPWEDIPEAYAALGFIAGVTTTLRLGVMVTGITHRHPVVLGKTIASLDVLSGGRAICGLGIAWDDSEHAAYGIDFPDVTTRYEILEETLEMLPLLWGQGSPEYRGRHIDASELICYPRPIQDPIPILIGGSGEQRTLRLVARHADACNVFGDPGRVQHKVAVLHRHCSEVGRDPADVEVTHLTNALAAPDRGALRRRVDHLRDRNSTPESFMKRHNAGTIDDLEELFADYSAAGADHSIVALPDVALEGSIEAFGEVIARFRSP